MKNVNFTLTEEKNRKNEMKKSHEFEVNIINVQF